MKEKYKNLLQKSDDNQNLSKINFELVQSIEEKQNICNNLESTLILKQKEIENFKNKID